jgi:hypothetical protein
MREIIEGGPRAAIAGRRPLPAIFPSAMVPPAKKRLANHARPKACLFLRTLAKMRIRPGRVRFNRQLFAGRRAVCERRAGCAAIFTLQNCHAPFMRCSCRFRFIERLFFNHHQ